MDRRRVPLLVIPLLALGTIVYLVGAIYVASTSHDWRHSDTFSVISGLAFFAISTLFAISLERRAEVGKQISLELRELLSNQRPMLEALGHKLEVDLTSVVERPAALGSDLRTGQATSPSSPTERQAVSTAASTDGHSEASEAASTSVLERIFARLFLITTGRRERNALEAAIEDGAEEAVVRQRFTKCKILALGQPARGPGGQLGEEADILHFTADDSDGHELVFMPIFTRMAAIRTARDRNPEWKKLSLLAIDGDALLANVDPDVTVVIDPWMRALEYQLPPDGQET